MIDHFSEKVMIGILNECPTTGDSLKKIIDEANVYCQKNVAVSLEYVYILDKSCISMLLALRETLMGREKKLVLYHVISGIMGQLKVLGYEGKFKICVDFPSAIEELMK